MRQAEELFTETICLALANAPFSELTGPLYHFTDRGGLIGILQTRSLWASLAMALDDSAEVRYALSRAAQLIESRHVTGDVSFLADIVPCLDSVASRTVSILGLKTYVASFRTNTDASAHWNTYARAGTGFALSFNPKALVIPGTLLLPVLYDPEQQDRLLRDFIESSARLFERTSSQCSGALAFGLRQRAVHWAALGLWTLAPLVKAPSVRDENEWRLIVVEPERVEVNYGKGISRTARLRTSNNRNIPYKVLEYDPLPIVGLELGARAPVAENDSCLTQLLRHATSGSDVSITRSKVYLEQAG